LNVADPHRRFEIRCPVHGFIELNDWEREIIEQPAFQRLRRIRQLAWTDQVYPGAMHTRFEHSLGVMHVATRLYDGIVSRSVPLLTSELSYDETGLERDRTLVRLAALLHDVGHGPFSHASEELLPTRGDDTRFKHEDYSAAIIRSKLRDVIDNHRLSDNSGIKAEDVTALLEKKPEAGRRLFWRELITGQMDADRMDYLLRDSLHLGVAYGRFDWQRLLHTIEAIPGDESQALRLGVNEGGWHAAEALVLARYFMFTQVYFHKTRVAFDHHMRHSLVSMLPGGMFPTPEGTELDDYLRWDDWRVLGLLADGKGGEHGERLAHREHYREVYHTPEVPKQADLNELGRVRSKLGSLVQAEESAERSWYKLEEEDIPVLSEVGRRKVRTLSKYSSFVAKMKPLRKVMIYVRPEDADLARRKLSSSRREPQ
jgi:HD superfamily phosphohydrolase